MRTSIAIAIAALLALPAAGQAAHQAVFDMTASGRWESTTTVHEEPGAECPHFRGDRVETQVLTLRYRGRVKIQHTHNRFDRWYLTPVRGSSMRGRAKLVHKRTDNTEKLYCEHTVWQPNDSRDRPLDRTCSRRLHVIAGLFKGGFRFGPATGGIGGRCVFDTPVEPFPLGTEDLRLVDRSAPRKLHRRRVVELEDEARRKKSEREGPDTVITELRSGEWKVTLKRRGSWKPWH